MHRVGKNYNCLNTNTIMVWSMRHSFWKTSLIFKFISDVSYARWCQVQTWKYTIYMYIFINFQYIQSLVLRKKKEKKDWISVFWCVFCFQFSSSLWYCASQINWINKRLHQHAEQSIFNDTNLDRFFHVCFWKYFGKRKISEFYN